MKDTNEILFSTSGKNKTVPGSGVAAAAAVAVVVAVLQAATRAVGGAVAGTRSGPVLVHLPLPKALHWAENGSGFIQMEMRYRNWE